jgi:hypothetical protein
MFHNDSLICRGDIICVFEQELLLQVENTNPVGRLAVYSVNPCVNLTPFPVFKKHLLAKRGGDLAQAPALYCLISPWLVN